MNQLTVDSKLVNTYICTECKQSVDKKKEAYFESTYSNEKTKKRIKTIRHQKCQ